MARRNASLKSPVGIARYTNLFVPRARKDDKGNEKGDAKFSVLLVFDRKADLDEMEQAVEDAAVAKFGNKAIKELANGRLKSCIRDADEYVDEDQSDEENYPFNLPGARMVRFATTDQPGVVDENAEPIMDKSEVYDGCKLRVSYRCFAYDKNGNRGVSVALINAQKIDDGKRLSGNPSAEDDFAPVKGTKSKAAAPARGRSRGRTRDEEDDVNDML